MSWWVVVLDCLVVAGYAHVQGRKVQRALVAEMMQRLQEKRALWAAEQQEVQDRCDEWERRAIALLNQHQQISLQVLAMLQEGASRARGGQVH